MPCLHNMVKHEIAPFGVMATRTCSNAGQATQGNIAQATSQIPRHGRRDFAVLYKRCRISWKLDIWKDLNRTEFLGLSQNGKVRSKYL